MPYICNIIINDNKKTNIMATLSKETKEKIQNMIFERAYEIEQKLSDDNFFLAKMGGINPCQVSDVALKCAIREIKKLLEDE